MYDYCEKTHAQWLNPDQNPVASFPDQTTTPSSLIPRPIKQHSLYFSRYRIMPGIKECTHYLKSRKLAQYSQYCKAWEWGHVQIMDGWYNCRR